MRNAGGPDDHHCSRVLRGDCSRPSSALDRHSLLHGCSRSSNLQPIQNCHCEYPTGCSHHWPVAHPLLSPTKRQSSFLLASQIPILPRMADDRICPSSSTTSGHTIWRPRKKCQPLKRFLG